MDIKKIDKKVIKFIQKKQPEPTDYHSLGVKVFRVITHSIAPVTVIFAITILSTLVLATGHFIKEIFFLILSVLPVLIGSIIKKITARPRPDESVAKIWVKEKSYNFPSTHAAVAFSLYGFLAFLSIWYEQPLYITILAIAMIGLISYSRVYLGAHYPSDIIAGWLLGGLNLTLLILIYNRTPESIFSIKILWLLFIISWIFIINYYRKEPENIPEFLRQPSNTMKRIYTGLVVFILTFIPMWIGGWIYKILLLFIFFTGFYEIITVKNISFRRFIYKTLGILILAICVYSVIALRGADQGKYYTLYFILTATIADTFGYFIGKNYGTIKIFGNLSPNKTLEGLTAGIFASCLIVGTLFCSKFQFSYLLTIFIAFMSVAGDLLESSLKRSLDIKDFSNFLPGHGGILDRVDSNLFAGFIMYILTTLKIVIFY